MEVHHHPEVEKKGLKEYLLEGFMIFVAVSMGFIAEGIRESMTKREKETEYIHSLALNLQEDIVSIGHTIHENEAKVRGLDSVLSLAGKNMNDPVNRKKLYTYSVEYISYYSGFGSNDATMIQLLNAGGLQYIRHGHIADSIARYDQEMRSIHAAETAYSKAINDGMDAASRLLIFRLRHDSLYYKDGEYRPNKLLPLLANDTHTMDVFFNKITYERGWTQNYIDNMKERVPYMLRLGALLKKEYDIKYE